MGEKIIRKVLDISRNVMYDKFIYIEGFAHRGSLLVEKNYIEKAKQACHRIRHELEELEVLLKIE